MTLTLKRGALIAATATAVAAGLVAIPGAAGAATAKSIPVVTVNAGKTLSLSRTHLAPGRVTFDVHSAKGESDLQLASLRSGYSFAQATKDINAAFGGNVAAVQRVDANMNLKGGVAATPKKPSRFTVWLSAGTYYATVNNLVKTITVSGATVNRKTVETNSTVTMLTYGFDSLPSIPRSGVMRLSNGADQPHFLVLIHVKSGTTHAQVAQALASNSQSTPKFVLSGGTSSGVLSPTRTQAFTYSLTAGRYVMACFWPDDKTGMPHAAMGMFKLVTLD